MNASPGWNWLGAHSSTARGRDVESDAVHEAVIDVEIPLRAGPVGVCPRARTEAGRRIEGGPERLDQSEPDESVTQDHVRRVTRDVARGSRFDLPLGSLLCIEDDLVDIALYRREGRVHRYRTRHVRRVAVEVRGDIHEHDFTGPGLSRARRIVQHGRVRSRTDDGCITGRVGASLAILRFHDRLDLVFANAGSNRAHGLLVRARRDFRCPNDQARLRHRSSSPEARRPTC